MPSRSTRLAPTSPLGPLLIFFVLAVAVLALVAAPFWILEDGIAHPLYSPVIALGMFGPALAALIVSVYLQGQRRGALAEGLGLGFRGRWRRILVWSLIGGAVVVALNALTAILMVVRGVPGDLTGRTWAELSTEQVAQSGLPLPTPAVVALIFVSTALGFAITVLPALGEEIGWRGWLWQHLAPLGRVPQVALGGFIWALWHVPILLIGHNYPGLPRPQAIGMFVLFCIAMNALLGALTERAGGNVIPAAVAHAALNTTLGLAISMVSTTETADHLNWYLDTLMGLPGIVLLAVVGALVMPRKSVQPRKERLTPRERHRPA